jgi:hypothetical protein
MSGMGELSPGRARRVHALSSVSLLLLACSLAPGRDAHDGKADGARCKQDDECASGTCTSYELCAHSLCDCPGSTCSEGGEASSDCQDNWVCTDAKSLFDPVREYFGGEPPKDKGYCWPRCEGGCPEHYSCTGTLCTPDTAWANPVPAVTWSGVVQGQLEGPGSQTIETEQEKSVTLRASATSPADASIASYAWTLVSGAGVYEMHSGPELSFSVEAGSFRRAELTVTDDQHRASMLTVIFSACAGTGAQCGFQGSGCCHGCDQNGQLCL